MASRLRHYLIDNGPLILDGGLSTELEAQGFNLQVKPTFFKIYLNVFSQVTALASPNCHQRLIKVLITEHCVQCGVHE